MSSGAPVHPSSSTLANEPQAVINGNQPTSSVVSPIANEGISPASILVQTQPTTHIDADTGQAQDITDSYKSRSPPKSAKVRGELPGRAIRFVEAIDEQKQARMGEQLAQNPRGLFKMVGRKATPHPLIKNAGER